MQRKNVSISEHNWDIITKHAREMEEDKGRKVDMDEAIEDILERAGI